MSPLSTDVEKQLSRSVGRDWRRTLGQDSRTSAEYDQVWRDLREIHIPSALTEAGGAANDDDLISSVVEILAPTTSHAPAPDVQQAAMRWFRRFESAKEERGPCQWAIDAVLMLCATADVVLAGRDPVDEPSRIAAAKAWEVPDRMLEALFAGRLARSATMLTNQVKRTSILRIPDDSGGADELSAHFSAAASLYLADQRDHRCPCYVCERRAPNARHLLKCFLPGSAQAVRYEGDAHYPLGKASNATSPPRSLEHWIDTWLIGAVSKEEGKLQVKAVEGGLLYRHFLAHYVTPAQVLRIGHVLESICTQESCNKLTAKRLTEGQPDYGNVGPEHRCPADPTHQLVYSTKRATDFMFFANPSTTRTALPASSAGSGRKRKVRVPANTHAAFEGLRIDTAAARYVFHWSGRQARWIPLPKTSAWTDLTDRSEQLWQAAGRPWQEPAEIDVPDPRVTAEEDLEGLDDPAVCKFEPAEVQATVECIRRSTELAQLALCLEAAGVLPHRDEHCPQDCNCSLFDDYVGKIGFCDALAQELIEQAAAKASDREGGPHA